MSSDIIDLPAIGARLALTDIYDGIAIKPGWAADRSMIDKGLKQASSEKPLRLFRSRL